MIYSRMIQDFFINEATVERKDAVTSYVDGISKKTYKTQCRPIQCRISSLSYKDLQLLSDTDNMGINVMKMYTDAEVDIDTKDIIDRDNKKRTIIAHYAPQDAKKVHHHKFFIKKVE